MIAPKSKYPMSTQSHQLLIEGGLTLYQSLSNSISRLTPKILKKLCKKARSFWHSIRLHHLKVSHKIKSTICPAFWKQNILWNKQFNANESTQILIVIMFMIREQNFLMRKMKSFKNFKCMLIKECLKASMQWKAIYGCINLNS